MSFAKIMTKKNDKNISKNLNSKYSQEHLDHAEESATDTLKTGTRRAMPKTAEATGDFIDNKIADKITKVSRASPQNNLETVETEIDT